MLTMCMLIRANKALFVRPVIGFAELLVEADPH